MKFNQYRTYRGWMRSFSLFILFVVFNSFNALAQGIISDSIVVRNFGANEYKFAPYTYDVVEDEHGIIYAANDNGVIEYDGSSWKLITIRGFSSAISLKMLKDGRIAVGGVNEFGFLERDSLGSYIYKSLREQLSDTLDIPEVWQIAQVDKEIYFHSYDGLFRFDGEQVLHLPIKNTWLLPATSELLVSVYNKGVARLINDSLVFVDESFRYEYDAPFKLLNYQGSKKIMLTEEHGLYLFDTISYKMSKWEVAANQVFEKRGLYDGLVWDDSTYLFASTRGGAYWVNRSGEIVRRITKEEGLESNYMREFIRDRRGNLWMSTDGLVHMVFPELQDTTNMTTMMREMIIQDSVKVINSVSAEIFLKEYGPVSSIEFAYATPGFDKIDLEYSYFLEGFDQRWSNWTDNVKKEYTNVPSGDYTFRVKSRHLGGSSISKKAVIKLHIPALWYKTSAAYAIGVFIVLMLIWAGAGYRTAKLKLKNDQLEQVVHARTKELVQQKEELVLANTELDNFVYRSSHDLIAPLKSLKGLIDITRKETSEEYRMEYYDMMLNSVVKLEDFIKSILEYSSNAKGTVEEELIDMNGLVDSVVDDLKYFEHADKVFLHREIDATIEFKSDPKRLKIILSNLIANAVKYHNYHQEHPSIEVRFFMSEGNPTLIVSDNGQGIEEKYLATIFDMFVRASEGSEGSGLGLYIVKDTVTKLKGTIVVSSEHGKGTTFTIQFQNS